MATSSTSATVGQLAKPEYRNWLALGHALTTELCQGLRPLINREMQTFYKNVTARVSALNACTCVRVPRRKQNQYHDMSTCAWAIILEAYHYGNKPNWKQSDPTKWIDPNLGPWEIAKLFLPDLGRHVDIKSADDMEITVILNLVYWCNQFTIPQTLICDVREARNNKWAHVPNLELTNADKKVAFDTIENLLRDRSVAHDPDVQQALKEIVSLKSVSNLHSMEARVLADFKEVIRREYSNMNTDLKKLMEESVRNKEQQSQLKQQQETMQKTLDNVAQRRSVESNLLVATHSLFCYVFRSLMGNVKGIRKKRVSVWLLLFMLCRLFVVLDYSLIGDGDCSVVPKYRKDCGYPGISSQECESKGCCFNSSIIGVIWCFHKGNCAVHPKDRKDCGYPGITSQECESKGCCFDSSITNTKWCFHQDILGPSVMRYAATNPDI